MLNLKWSREELTKQKLGAFCEYYAKMVLTSYGMSIYTSEVDDHGIDFVAENNKVFFRFQVKSVRKGTTYVFMRKKYFKINDDTLYLILFLLTDGEYPDMYIIPTSAWINSEGKLFVDRDYDGIKSEPEYGINLSQKNIPLLEKYKFKNMIDKICDFKETEDN